MELQSEKVSLAYLAERGLVDMPIRFDEMAMAIISPDRATIRHHINSMASDSLGDALSEAA